MRWAGERDQEYCRSASSASAMESKTCSDHFRLTLLVVLEAFRLAIASIISTPEADRHHLAVKNGGIYLQFFAAGRNGLSCARNAARLAGIRLSQSRWICGGRFPEMSRSSM